MTNHERYTLALILLALATAVVLWRWARRPVRETITVPGVGRVQLATDEESERWRQHYEDRVRRLEEAERHGNGSSY